MPALALAHSRADDRLSPSPKAFSAPPSLNKLGRRMRAARERRDFSQSHIARLMGVAKQTISNWETACAPPGLESLIRFAAIVDIDVAELFNGLSTDVTPMDESRRRLAAASQLIPLYKLVEAGDILMGAVLKGKVEPERFVATLTEHPRRALAFTINGTAMRPRFCDGDVVTILPADMAESGQFVLACTDGNYVFRRFLPATGKRPAILRALNPNVVDIHMIADDRILGVMKEHVSIRHDD